MRWSPLSLVLFTMMPLWSHGATAPFAFGDRVRLTTSETLLFNGDNLAPATKGQEFSVLKHDVQKNLVYVAYYKPDASRIAATLPAAALEASPADSWADLLHGVEAFRDGRLEEARKALAAVGNDAPYKAIATNVLAGISGLNAAAGQGAAGQAATTRVAAGLRTLAAQLNGGGYYSLAAALEEGIDRFGPGTPEAALPAGALSREELRQRATAATQAMVRVRQSMAMHCMMEAKKLLEPGLTAEPKRPDLLAFQAKIAREIRDADQNFENAEKMRRFVGGTVHALTALEHGLKSCSDHPKLRALRQEMQGAVEERTSPAITPALLATAKMSSAPTNAEEGRKLYTTRCTECHDLDALDSRSLSGWERMVGSMSGRARLNEAQRARIMEYLTVAWTAVSNMPQ